MTSTQHTTDTIDGFPVYKFGSRWICEGPEGAFQARTRRDAVALLRSTSGGYSNDGEYKQIVADYYAKAAK